MHSPWYSHNKTETEKWERNIAIWRMRISGKLLREVGDEFHIGKERVRQICHRVERAFRGMLFREDVPDWFDDQHVLTERLLKKGLYGVTLTFEHGDYYPVVSYSIELED